MAIMALPEQYRRRLRTTNGVERLNEEIRRRERVIRIFPNEESALRLMGAVLMEIDENWTTGHRYFDMVLAMEGPIGDSPEEDRKEAAGGSITAQTLPEVAFAPDPGLDRAV